MTDTLATKPDLQQLEDRLGVRFAQIDARFAQVDSRFAQVDARFAQVDARFEYLEKHIDARFGEHSARFTAQISDLERRITLRMLAGIGAVSAIVKLL